MAGTVKLTDQVLLGLARTGPVRNRFAAFRALYNSLGRRGCGGCRKRRQQARLLPALKDAIAKDSALAQALKKHLRADALIVFVREGKRVVKKTL